MPEKSSQTFLMNNTQCVPSRTSFTCLQGEGTLTESSLRRSSVLLAIAVAPSSGSSRAPGAGLEETLSSSLFSFVRCSCFESSSRCFWKNSGSLKHFSRLAARWRVVGELGVERENSSSSRSRFSVLLLHIRGGSWSRNVLRWPFDTSHIVLTKITEMGCSSSTASFAESQSHDANILRMSLEGFRLYNIMKILLGNL